MEMIFVLNKCIKSLSNGSKSNLPARRREKFDLEICEVDEDII